MWNQWRPDPELRYGIDTSRIAAVGDAAGGAISLSLSAVSDAHPATPYGSYSASVSAAVATGAHLTPGLDAGLLPRLGTEAPILLFHVETDVASAPGPLPTGPAPPTAPMHPGDATGPAG